MPRFFRFLRREETPAAAEVNVAVDPHDLEEMREGTLLKIHFRAYMNARDERDIAAALESNTTLAALLSSCKLHEHSAIVMANAAVRSGNPNLITSDLSTSAYLKYGGPDAGEPKVARELKALDAMCKANREVVLPLLGKLVAGETLEGPEQSEAVRRAPAIVNILRSPEHYRHLVKLDGAQVDAAYARLCALDGAIAEKYPCREHARRHEGRAEQPVTAPPFP